MKPMTIVLSFVAVTVITVHLVGPPGENAGKQHAAGKVAAQASDSACLSEVPLGPAGPDVEPQAFAEQLRHMIECTYKNVAWPASLIFGKEGPATQEVMEAFENVR